MVISSDGDVITPIRGTQAAIMSEGRGKFHCSASGVFEWSTERDADELPFDFFDRGMQGEILRELFLSPSQYVLAPVAFARELPRGGKPQLFYVAKAHLKTAEIKAAMSKATEKCEFISPAQLPPGSPLNSAMTDPETVDIGLTSQTSDSFTYEGTAARLFLALLLQNKMM